MSDTCTFAEFLDHCTGRKVMPPPAQAKKRPSCPPESEEQKALFDWWQASPTCSLPRPGRGSTACTSR